MSGIAPTRGVNPITRARPLTREPVQYEVSTLLISGDAVTPAVDRSKQMAISNHRTAQDRSTTTVFETLHTNLEPFVHTSSIFGTCLPCVQMFSCCALSSCQSMRQIQTLRYAWLTLLKSAINSLYFLITLDFRCFPR